MKTILKGGDFVVIALSLAVLLFSIFQLRGKTGESPYLVVEGPDAQYLYSLSRDRTIEVPGDLGNSVIVIEGGTARFESSPCPNKTCVHTGKISRAGEVAACLPNRVIIHVDTRSDESAFDAVME